MTKGRRLCWVQQYSANTNTTIENMREGENEKICNFYEVGVRIAKYMQNLKHHFLSLTEYFTEAILKCIELYKLCIVNIE